MARVLAVVREGDRWLWLAVTPAGDPVCGTAFSQAVAEQYGAICDQPAPPADVVTGWNSGLSGPRLRSV